MTEAVRPDGGAITRGFLFADLRGYTAYVEAHGDAGASALLDVYRRLMRDTVARHDGAEIKTEGDSFYVVFPSASGAVLCGLDIVAAAAAQSIGDPDHPIRVGIGVHAGESVAGAEGYVGSAVNIAARVCALAKPGEVLVTDTVRGLTRTSGRLIFTSVGRRTLKGITEPIALYRAEPTGSGLLAAAGGRGPIWRRRSVLAGAGGVLLLGIVSAVAVTGVLGPGGFSGSASPTPRGTEPAETLVPSGTPAPIPFHIGALDAGTYVSSVFRPQIQFRLPSGWVGGPDQPMNRALGLEDADALDLTMPSDPNSGIFMNDALVVVDGMCMLEENFRPFDSPLELIEFLQANTNLVASNPVPKTVGGSTGYSITISNARVPSPGDCPPVVGHPSNTGRAGIPIVKSAGNDYWVDGDHVVMVISLQVRDHTVAIFVESPPEDALDFQAAAERILATVTFPED